MLRPALVIIAATTALVLGGLVLLLGFVAAVKLAVFVAISIALASTLVALSPRLQP